MCVQWAQLFRLSNSEELWVRQVPLGRQEAPKLCLRDRLGIPARCTGMLP